MPKVTFLETDGTAHVVEAEAGASVMSAAFDNAVPGIDADCGGLCACGTCHVYIAKDWMDRLAESTDEEKQMLVFAESSNERSRLSCQITLTDELNGLTVHLPEFQH